MFKKVLFLCFSSLVLIATSCESELNEEKEKKFIVEFSDDFKTSYILNESISYDGLTVIDNVTGEETSLYNISPNEGARLRKPGKQEVIISYYGYEDFTFTVDVKDDGTYVETQQIDLYSVNDFHGSFLENGSEIGMSKLGAFLKDQKDNLCCILERLI